MRVCFLAEKPCGLRINGAYLGMVDGFERTTAIEPGDGVFCELLPAGGFLPVRFTFDEDFLLSPPPQINLYYTGAAVAVYAGGFVRADSSTQVLWQERVGGVLLTLAQEGRLRLYYGGRQARILDLPDALAGCRPAPLGRGILLRAENAFAYLGDEGELKLLSEGKVLSAEGTLKAEVPFHDSAGHSAVCEWAEGALVSCTVRTAREPTAATFALALFESVLIGADPKPFLAPSLSERAGMLKEYLGDYRSVVLTGSPNRVGLVYERSPRVFDVRYFRVEFSEGKISNLAPLPASPSP